jgi:hypothetical protein
MIFEHQLGHRDHRHQRGVLDQADQGIAHRRHRHPQRLRQHHVAQGLAPAQPEAVGRPPLALATADGAAQALGQVGAGVQRQRQHPGRHRREFDADAGQAVVDDEQLHQQRRAAEHADIERRRPAHRRPRRTRISAPAGPAPGRPAWRRRPAAAYSRRRAASAARTRAAGPAVPGLPMRRGSSNFMVRG